MEKKFNKKINVKLGQNQKKISGNIFQQKKNLSKNTVKAGQKISGKISFKK